MLREVFAPYLFTKFLNEVLFYIHFDEFFLYKYPTEGHWADNNICLVCTPLPQRPSAAIFYYNTLAVRGLFQVATSGVLNVFKILHGWVISRTGIQIVKSHLFFVLSTKFLVFFMLIFLYCSLKIIKDNRVVAGLHLVGLCKEAWDKKSHWVLIFSFHSCLSERSLAANFFYNPLFHVFFLPQFSDISRLSLQILSRFSQALDIIIK